MSSKNYYINILDCSSGIYEISITRVMPEFYISGVNISDLPQELINYWGSPIEDSKACKYKDISL